MLSYKTVFSHYRKWCKTNVWKSVWVQYLYDHKSDLDLSHIDFDGSHNTSLKGGADVSYQGQKKRKTCNSIFVTDNQGFILAVSKSVKGEHHDLFDIESVFKSLMEDLKASNIKLDGLFLNVDAGFDSSNLRKDCIQ